VNGTERTARIEALRRAWTDRYVEVRPDRPELARFAGVVGRVVTVNWNGLALVDFQDGAWYDIPASDEYLRRLSTEEAAGKYDPANNSARVRPERQN
jgi:hypothetical protein